MIISVDIETAGLDARKFICGAIMKEGYKTAEIYDNKEALWQRVLELGRKEYKRGKVLNVYGHNIAYDFYGIADITDKGLRFFSHSPFIASYMIETDQIWKEGPMTGKKKKKEIIKFLDTYSIYAMSLKEVGKLIGLEKMELPEELLNENTKPTRKLIEKIIPYLTRDVEITLKAVQYMREKLKKEGINIKRLYTINQIAIQYLLAEFKKTEYSGHIFLNPKTNQIYQTIRAEEIHAAYRGGRVECFQTGKLSSVTEIDCINNYGYSSMHMRFPNLKTERKIWKPLKVIKKDRLLKLIGVSRCLIYNKSNDLGLLPIRTGIGTYYPRRGSWMIGTWTHEELKHAKEEGYEIIDIEWSILWDDGPNPFKTVIPKLYRLRGREKGTFNYYFYKRIMNAGFGKFGQTRVGQEFVIDSIETARDYLKNNYKLLTGVDKENIMYHKEGKKEEVRKPFYAPIIPTMINAQARIYMYYQYKKIPLDKLVYTDTDSIVFEGNYMNRFDISERIGSFKIEAQAERAIIWGRKSYSIGENIKIAGIRKKDITIEQFEKGYVTSKKMITLGNTRDIKELGGFQSEERDLNQQIMNHDEMMENLSKNTFFVDSDIKEINYFLEVILEKGLTERFK